MSAVYQPENFAGRVKLAAAYISAGREGTRTFDTCFEMSDGAAVALALYRRTIKNPETQLAANLFRYLGRDALMATVEKYADIRTADLPSLAAQLRHDARQAFARAMVERGHEEFRTELTPEGEQTVIPGCERNESPRAKQLDLFG